MKLGAANTLFTRLFALVVGAIVVSHVVSFGLFFFLFRDHLAGPPRGPDAGILIMFGAELVALASAAWLGAKLVARPIRQLAGAAAELGENVDRPALAEEGPIEARQAARAFNRMQSRLREQIAARARFLAAVSHDLRTPLTRIRLRVGRLEEGEDSARLRADVEEMATMLDATLDYLRGESLGEGAVLLDVQALVESMVEDYQEQGWAISVGGACAPLLLQPNALRRALGNLMENALRYGGRAAVECIEHGDGLSITIRDQGPGIPEGELVAVMEPFYRVESSRNKQTGGVGLGLAIAREAIVRQGGTLRLMNAGAGGLIAAVHLPRYQPGSSGSDPVGV